MVTSGTVPPLIMQRIAEALHGTTQPLVAVLLSFEIVRDEREVRDALKEYAFRCVKCCAWQRLSPFGSRGLLCDDCDEFSEEDFLL